MPATSMSTLIAQLTATSTAFMAAGGIFTLTFYDVPILQSQPASSSLPAIRWLFSRGSHTFPQASAISSASFLYLAYKSLPSQPFLTSSSSQSLITTIGQRVLHGKVPFYLSAALLTISIAPWTALVMIPTNFSLIEKNAAKGGKRSAESAAQIQKQKQMQKQMQTPDRNQQADSGRSKITAEDSVAGKGEGVAELTDLSGPQTRTELDTTNEEDGEVRELLGRFGRLNSVRGVLIGLGGLVGLWTALV